MYAMTPNKTGRTPHISLKTAAVQVPSAKSGRSR